MYQVDSVSPHPKKLKKNGQPRRQREDSLFRLTEALLELDENYDETSINITLHFSGAF
jgi:hypothetical protein